MSYQPYPTTGDRGYGQLQRPPQPRSVRIAVLLMYGGAALSALSAILVLAFSGSIKSAVMTAARNSNATLVKQGRKPLTAAQIHTLANLTLVVLVVILVIGVFLWVWMAWANGRGKNWARIVASVLFGLDTVYFFLSLARAGASVTLIGLTWLLGLGAIVLLWRRESSAYFRPGQK